MFRRKPRTKNRIKVLLIDELNDLQSQIAEYFLSNIYGDKYRAYSAGPKSQYVDCELISVMYQLGYDIRAKKSKDFTHGEIPNKLDYVIFLEEATYDKHSSSVPWDAPQIVVDFGRKNNFEKATNDIELFKYYRQFIERVKIWTENTFENIEKLKLMTKS